MKFAGKDFIYLSQKKLDKINSFNPKNNPQKCFKYGIKMKEYRKMEKFTKK